MNFTIDHIALHLIDKKLSGPQLATSEINLSTFNADDRKAIQEFFSGHIDQIWEAQEGSSVRTATFLKSSQIRQQYKVIASDPTGSFLSNSCAMAKSLHSVTPGNVPSGLLMSLWLRVEKVKRPFLALFKMDPGRADKVVVPSEGDQLLLNLAVRHIDGALPDPNRVLKWAITPHPTRRAYDVKIKDFSNSREPAQYFMKFLGCEAEESEKAQINVVFQKLTPGAAGMLVHHLGQMDIADIDNRVLLDAASESGALSDAETETLRQLPAVLISAKAFQMAKIEYKLKNEIIIKGPRAAMEAITIVHHGEDDHSFTINTTGYEKKYV